MNESIHSNHRSKKSECKRKHHHHSITHHINPNSAPIPINQSFSNHSKPNSTTNLHAPPRNSKILNPLHRPNPLTQPTAPHRINHQPLNLHARRHPVLDAEAEACGAGHQTAIIIVFMLYLYLRLRLCLCGFGGCESRGVCAVCFFCFDFIIVFYGIVDLRMHARMGERSDDRAA